MEKGEWPGLSQREENVLSLFQAGLADKEVAAALHLSLHTVRTYWLRIKRKADKTTRPEVLAEIGRRRHLDALARASASAGAEVEAKRSELEGILGKAPVLVWAYEASGSLYFLNERLMDYIGMAATDPLPATWAAIIPADIYPQIYERATKNRTEGEVFEYEIPLKRHDGNYRTHLVREVPILADDQSVVERVGAATDIHDLRHPSRPVDDPIDRLRMIIDLSDLAIAYNDPSTKAVFRNPAYARITNSLDWIQSIHPDDQERVKREWDATYGTSELLHSSHRYLRDGSVSEVECYVLRRGGDAWIFLARDVDSFDRNTNQEKLIRLAKVIEDILALPREPVRV